MPDQVASRIGQLGGLLQLEKPAYLVQHPQRLVDKNLTTGTGDGQL